MRKFNLIKNFYSNKLIYLLVFLKILNNFVGFVTPVVEKWLIHKKSSVAAPVVLILLRVLSYDWPQNGSDTGGEEIIRWLAN